MTNETLLKINSDYFRIRGNMPRNIIDIISLYRTDLSFRYLILIRILAGGGKINFGQSLFRRNLAN